MAARALGEEALKLFEQARWQAAYDKFAAAHEHLRAPTLVLFMARCKRNLGDLVAARGLYEGVLRKPLPAKASEPFVKAKAKARTELDQLKPRIPAIRISLSGAEPKRTSVKIDGIALPSVDVGQAVAVNPGKHTITATAAGFQAASKTVDLPESATVTEVSLKLLAEGAQPIDPPEPNQHVDGPLWPAILTLGVGTAGLALGAITGAMASSRADDIKSRCVDNHCPAEDADLGDEAQTLATLSTTGFVVGGVAAAAGIVLAITRPGGGSTEQDSGLLLELAPFGLGGQLRGSF